MKELSPQEVRILKIIAEGCTDQEIGARLKIKLNTVSSAILRMRIKMDARNRAHAVAIGYQRGVLK